MADRAGQSRMSLRIRRLRAHQREPQRFERRSVMLASPVIPGRQAAPGLNASPWAVLVMHHKGGSSDSGKEGGHVVMLRCINGCPMRIRFNTCPQELRELVRVFLVLISHQYPCESLRVDDPIFAS